MELSDFWNKQNFKNTTFLPRTSLVADSLGAEDRGQKMLKLLLRCDQFYKSSNTLKRKKKKK